MRKVAFGGASSMEDDHDHPDHAVGRLSWRQFRTMIRQIDLERRECRSFKVGRVPIPQLVVT